MIWLDILNTYAPLITAVGSLSLIVVTLIYVIDTRKIQKTAEASFALGKQPCIFPNFDPDCCVGSSLYSKESGWKMRLYVGLQNVGDSPAISVYVFGKILLQVSQTHEIHMTTAPRLTPYVTVTDSLNGVQLYFSECDIKQLMEEMNTIHEIHPEYINTEKTSAQFGPILEIQILYKNLVGVWFLGTFTRKIHYMTLIPTNCICGESEDQLYIPQCKELPKNGYEFLNLYVGGEDISEINIYQISDTEAMKLIPNS